MSSGIFVVHCAACYAASSVAIPPHVMRHVLCPLYGILSPYARFPPTHVGLTLGAIPPSSFLPFPSFDISICRISLSRNLRCPARPALSCAREFRERSSLLLLWARGIGGLAARTLVPLGFFFPRPVRRILAAPPGTRPMRVYLFAGSRRFTCGAPSLFSSLRFFLFACGAPLP